MIRPLMGGGSSNCKAKDENVGRRRCRHLLCPCSDNSLKAIDIIQKHGGEAYLVGGCVRDMVLKEKPHDEDITTSLTPEQVTEVFESKGFKVIPTGIQHGTVTVMMDGEGYEITTFRKDSTYSDGRHPDSVEFSTDVYDDCSRRDFTFNAMYYDGKQIIDQFNGQKDIEDKVIRTVGNPDDRFNEDALRMMRALRFSSKLDFSIAPEVIDSIERNKEKIKNVSAERIQAELSKTLMGKNRRYAFEVMQKTGILKEILPELDALKEVRQNPKYHYEDAFEHTLTALENTPDDVQVRYAVLFHDLGKATCQQVGKDGVVHFVHHERESEKIANTLCKRLKMSNTDRKTIVKLVKNHNCPYSERKAVVARFIVSHQDFTSKEMEQLQAVWNADWKAHKFFTEDEWKKFNVFNTNLSYAMKGPHRLKDLRVNGDDLKDRYSGKEIKEKLDLLLRLVIINHLERRDSIKISNKNKRKPLLKILNKMDKNPEKSTK